MSEYPGQTPDPADVPQSEQLHDPGYWERQAAEQAREQEQQGHPEHTAPITPQQGQPVWNPTSAQPPPGYESGQGQGQGQAPPPPAPPAYGQPPYQQPSYGQPQYGQPAYGQPAYGQPAYGQPAYGQPAWAGAGSPYSAFSPPRADHPQSTTAMVLGIVGLAAGFLFCGVGFVVSPFAWAIGRRSLKDISASQGQLGGESQARSGMIMGIIGTVLLILALALLALFVVGIATSSTSGDFSSSTNA